MLSECKEDEYRCRTNVCIPSEYKCDYIRDCDDNSDEIDGCKWTHDFILHYCLNSCDCKHSWEYKNVISDILVGIKLSIGI